MEQELLTLDQANALLDQAVERINAVIVEVNVLLIVNGREIGLEMKPAPADTLQEALAMLFEYEKDLKRRIDMLAALQRQAADKQRLIDSTDEYASFWLRRFAKDLDLEIPK